MSRVENRQPGKGLSAVETMPFPGSYEQIEETFDSGRDVVCLSHLRWDFVYQRPQHLMSRFAREGRVFYVEEPVFQGYGPPDVEMRIDKSGVCLVVPILPEDASPGDARLMQKRTVDMLFEKCAIRDGILWYYTPMARAFTAHLPSAAIVYDCMDELSLFKGAPRDLKRYEAELMRAADVVFTGGFSLYQAKRSLHRNVHAAPSSIDLEHFRQARFITESPGAQSAIKRPRLGFAGVIDERMDLDLIAEVAAMRPEWQFVMLGPVVKIDPGALPQRPNIHYLGQVRYEDLPAYMAGWDVALIPFALNDATRFISPTKTPEYLAAGRRVVSTPINDVAHTYGSNGLVRIADGPVEFAAAIAESLNQAGGEQASNDWLERVDAFLATTSWDRTWTSMTRLVESAIAKRELRPAAAC
jgi:UDP-galactopyranose mutase